jgi:lysophospholipase L1-like esterase
MKTPLTQSCLLVLLTLLVLELIVRIFFAQNMSGRFEYGYHPRAGFVQKKDGSVDLVRAGGRRFRPQSFETPKAPGTYRIFVIGDSVPRGPSLEEAYPRQLQNLLTQSGLHAEVINLGIAGNGIRRSRIITDQLFQYEPDLLIFHLNDTNEYEDEREWRRAQEMGSWHPRAWLTKSLLIARLHELKTEKIYWFWLPEKVRQTNEKKDQDQETLALDDPEIQKIWAQRLIENTAELKKQAEEKNVPLLLVLQGRLEMDSGNARVITSENLRFLEPSPTLLSMESALAQQAQPKSFFSDTAHLNARGHLVLAEKLQEKILSLRASP